jgi:uncharacterized protein with HEPN domain
MYDRLLTLEILRRLEESLGEVVLWTERVTSAHDFVSTPDGMILLNAVCMKLLAAGEEVKALDRRTGGALLPQYSEIPWKEVKGLRDIIAHHYFDVDAGEIFTVIRTDIPPLLKVIHKMIKNISE